jgi:hypothetical protein
LKRQMVAETQAPGASVSIVARPDRDGVIEIAFGCGARVRLRGEVSSETLRQVIELLR